MRKVDLVDSRADLVTSMIFIIILNILPMKRLKPYMKWFVEVGINLKKVERSKMNE